MTNSIKRQLIELKTVDFPKGRTGYEMRSICNGQLMRLMLPDDPRQNAINDIQVWVALRAKIPLVEILRRQLGGRSGALENWTARRILQHR